MNVGDRLTPLERTLDLPRLVAYAGATWDWNRLHYDTEYAAARGMAAPVVDGQMFGALMAEQAMTAAGAGSFPVAMSFRFKSPVFAGESVTVDGEVEARDGSTVTIAQRVTAGDRVAATGTTTLQLAQGE